MRTIQDTETVKVTVSKNEVLNDRWISAILLSKKLGEIEKQKEMVYKHLRNRFYNSKAHNKYNTENIAGIDCIDIKNTMKSKASLELSFEVV